MKGWVKIFSSEIDFHGEIAKGILVEEGINCILLNKQDSMYPNVIGEVELYVPKGLAIPAKHLIQKIEF